MTPDDDGDDDDYTEDHGKYSLGEPAADAYEALQMGRESVCEMGRNMAELTVPSVFPPLGYKAGEDLPGNNQSFGAHCVNNLASKLMFLAFPPGQPIMKLQPDITKYSQQIAENKELYGHLMQALSQLEVQHREKLQTTPISTAYSGYCKLLVVGGNALWKHVKLNSPSFHRPDSYVVQRDRNGHPLLSIHEEIVRFETLDDDTKAMIREVSPELFKDDLKGKRAWEREVTIYSVCKLKGSEDDRSWCYWQEYEGRYIDGTGIETDYDDCPQWPGWLIPVYGDNWGRGYCEEYRGDLFTAEANASALNDIAALAGFALPFVKPSARTSLKRVREAKNLEWQSGSAEDLSVFRSEKTGDGQFVVNNLEAVCRRLGAAFCLESAVRRDGERVTKEEVVRIGRQLDQAMGGIYTEFGQGNQRRVIVRAVRLNEEASKTLPPIPPDVSIGIITGVDAMGRSAEEESLRELAVDIGAAFSNPLVAKVINPSEYARRLTAAKGIKPDGLVNDEQSMEQQAQAEKQAAMQASLVEQGTAPVAGALADALSQRVIPPPQEGNQQ